MTGGDWSDYITALFLIDGGPFEWLIQIPAYRGILWLLETISFCACSNQMDRQGRIGKWTIEVGTGPHDINLYFVGWLSKLQDHQSYPKTVDRMDWIIEQWDWFLHVQWTNDCSSLFSRKTQSTPLKLAPNLSFVHPRQLYYLQRAAPIINQIPRTSIVGIGLLSSISPYGVRTEKPPIVSREEIIHKQSISK